MITREEPCRSGTIYPCRMIIFYELIAYLLNLNEWVDADIDRDSVDSVSISQLGETNFITDLTPDNEANNAIVGDSTD